MKIPIGTSSVGIADSPLGANFAPAFSEEDFDNDVLLLGGAVLFPNFIVGFIHSKKITPYGTVYP